VIAAEQTGATHDTRVATLVLLPLGPDTVR